MIDWNLATIGVGGIVACLLFYRLSGRKRFWCDRHGGEFTSWSFYPRKCPVCDR